VTRLLEYALTLSPEKVLDVGVGSGVAAKAFIASGSHVVGIDVKDSPHEHKNYVHIKSAVEMIDPAEDAEPYDLIWCSHLLQKVPNVQAVLVMLSDWLKDDGWLFIAVPSASQDRFHIGNLTLWTPAHLVYNLICAGWDCKDAKWYTEYDTIGFCVQKKRITDMSWRTGESNEANAINEYSPVHIRQDNGAWWANRWHEDTGSRVIDPPQVTAGVYKTNLPPQVQLAYGPNPNLRIAK